MLVEGLLRYLPLGDLVVHDMALQILVQEILYHHDRTLLGMCFEVLVVAEGGILVVLGPILEGDLLQCCGGGLKDLGELRVQGLREA